MLTNDVVRFEQLGPDDFAFNKLSPKQREKEELDLIKLESKECHLYSYTNFKYTRTSQCSKFISTFASL